MHNPELRVELPPDLPGESYEGIRQAVASLLELWGVPDVSARLVGPPPGPAAVVGNGPPQ